MTAILEGTRAMTYELRKVKIARNLSEETTAFTAELWLDGRKVADCSNHGQGGSTGLFYVSPEDRDAHEAFCAAQPNITSKWNPDGLKFDADLHVGELLSDYDLTQTFKRKCRKNVLFILTERKPGEYLEIRDRRPSPGSKEALRAHVVEKYGDKIELIVNDDIPAAVKALRS